MMARACLTAQMPPQAFNVTDELELELIADAMLIEIEAADKAERDRSLLEELHARMR